MSVAAVGQPPPWVPPPDFGNLAHDLGSLGFHIPPVVISAREAPQPEWLIPPRAPTGGSLVTNEEIPGAGAVTAWEMKLLTDPTVDPVLTAHGFGRKSGKFHLPSNVVHIAGTNGDEFAMHYIPGEL